MLTYVEDLAADGGSVCNHYHRGPFRIPAKTLLRALRKGKFTFVLGLDDGSLFEGVHLFTEDPRAGQVLDPNCRLGPVEVHEQLVMYLGS